MIKIETVLSGDYNYPGLLIRVAGKELVLVEYSEDEKKHMIHVWDHETVDDGADEVYHQDIPDDFKEPEVE